MSSAAVNAAADAERALRDASDAVAAGVTVVIQSASTIRMEAAAALAQANEIWEEARRECKRLRRAAREEVTQMKGNAAAEAEEIRFDAREALEEERAGIEKVHAFARSKIQLDVGGGGHRFATSLQTLTSVPDTFLASMFSGRFNLQPDAEGVYFIDRNGTHFCHILDYLRDPGSFTLSPAMAGGARAELAVEAKFYGLLDRMMPYYAQEQIGVSLLKQACATGTELALEAAVAQARALVVQIGNTSPWLTEEFQDSRYAIAVAQARALVVQIGNTSPWLTEEFQDSRYAITERVINGAPVWAAEDGEWFMYLTTSTRLYVSRNEFCAKGDPLGFICHAQLNVGFLAPTMLCATGWKSNKYATLASQYASAGGTYENAWLDVPNMRFTAVHGLADDEPAMAAALRQLAALNERPRKRARSQE
eukprot:CAMPEP_0197614646 /NCGR_PEP_ID=MMETSP1326-20131121/59631_1 /TAXON_ID=1155430 /ORGANISM="Genus nov. species nov., Strain RCC2288" /LENGTH=422 /DNA_ID=CAMNT_0043183521 /DNA_START=245 /DNA_END=1513 /DNA_ORIENTATION=+